MGGGAQDPLGGEGARIAPRYAVRPARGRLPVSLGLVPGTPTRAGNRPAAVAGTGGEDDAFDPRPGSGGSSSRVRLFIVVLLGLASGFRGGPIELSNEAKEEFLRTAKPVEAHRVGRGVTETWRVTLQREGLTHDASFQSVDERAPVKRLDYGEIEIDFVDSYRYNIAAYRLAKLVGLDDMVPVSVEREWRGKTGAMTWWVDDVMMDEVEMYERGLKPPDPAEWTHQVYRIQVFSELIYDTDRNQGNHLITSEWKIWMIDFTRGFRRWPKLEHPDALVRCDRELFEALSELTRERVDAELSDILHEDELDGVWARRGLIVEHFQKLIEERGEAAVLY